MLVDFNEIISNAVKEGLNDELYDIICHNISEDTQKEWWIDNVCTPVKNVIIDELKNGNNKDLLKDCLKEVLDMYFSSEDIEEMIKDILKEEIHNKINNITFNL